jgi:DNA-directed RNA polymerase specialized sigma24 family protein
MRNLRYRQVLIYTYIVGVDESEQARRLQVRVQDIYLWRHRALKALRSKPELIQGLRSLLD